MFSSDDYLTTLNSIVAKANIAALYFACEWIIRLIMVLVVPLRRTPEATRSWLLLIFFLPIPGLLLYLAIGRPRFPVWRAARFAQLAPFLSDLARRLNEVAAASPEPAGNNISDLVTKLGRLPALPGNSIEFLDDYDGTIDRLVADIDQARHHVRLVVYIFADDAIGRRVINALARAAARGVACNVLIDAFGSHRWSRHVIRRLTDAGVTAELALPRRLIRGRTRRDMRNHRKLFIVDGIIGYAGSQNIVDKDFRPGITNRELVVRTTGPVVAAMSAVFLADWFLETEILLDARAEIPGPAGDAGAQLLPSGADYPLEGFETLLIWQIHAAKKRVIITTPYLIPDQGLIGAMRTAALRGVQVDLIVSAVADQALVSLAQHSYYTELLNDGIRIHRFEGYLLHAKNVSIDGRLAIIGSSNVDIRSFQLNEEVSLLLFDGPSVARLEKIQSGYIQNSTPVSTDEWQRRPMIRKLGENLARLVSPLL